jgi:tetratricopeptide (TPR) repeat protein
VVETGDVPVTVADSEPGVGAGAVLRAIGGTGKQIKLPAKAIVGRAADCDVVLDDESVSRRHAQLARDERGLYRVRDLDSGNGTFLDGKEIGKEPVLVPAGARLRFGEVELVFCQPKAGLSGQKLLLGALVAMLALVGALIAFRPARRDGAESAAAGATAVGEKALAALYPDAALRAAMARYARGDTAGALRGLSALRARGASEALERIKLVDRRFREGQAALLSKALDRADRLWGEALRADAALMPARAESFLGRQMRATLLGAHAKAGDERFSRGQYAGAYDEWTKGLALSPRDPQLLDQLPRLEKVAERILSAGSPSCDQLAVAAHITRADPPSPAHQAAQKGLSRCR